ncbi:MAG: selenium-dependent molybdenum cofactor biosynthesis protein YqeB, partial [Anaerolineae bacterium]
MAELILVRGGGDLASGVAMRLHRVGMKVVITELPQPLAVRRAISFAEAVYAGQITVEEITARLVPAEKIQETLAQNEIPVVIDPQAQILLQEKLHWAVVVDARMMKSPPEPLPRPVSLHIGLGPGFRAGGDC